MKPLLRKAGYLAVLMAVGGYAYLSLKGPQGLPTLLERRALIRQLESRNQELEAEIRKHLDEIRRMEHNQRYVDDVLRQEFQYTQPEDLEFKLPGRKPAFPPPAPKPKR